ncbi:hypothetical protein [Noviherbaspirillum malthae]|uniref:hypothetical protein n=1 Tax=Noviherbaspirillum malthae TaxID=1260987 RepID=UPI0018904D42|nr:hypothetical protein [Noviherbaspirillum malthae]
MTQDEILTMFRQQAKDLPSNASALNTAILELAQLLADSRGRLSKENFEVLVRIGGALYKNGHNQFHGKNDVDAIMKHSHRNHDEGRGSH